MTDGNSKKTGFSVPVAEREGVIAYAFIRGREVNGGKKTVHFAGPVHKGKSWPEGKTLGDVNRMIADRQVTVFVSINPETENGLITYMEPLNGSNGGPVGPLAD